MRERKKIMPDLSITNCASSTDQLAYLNGQTSDLNVKRDTIQHEIDNLRHKPKTPANQQSLFVLEKAQQSLNKKLKAAATGIRKQEQCNYLADAADIGQNLNFIN